jgi:hypothetical protein
MTRPEHDPIKRMVTIAGLGRRFEIVCPCGNAPTRRLTGDEAREEMQRHELRAGDAVSSS